LPAVFQPVIFDRMNEVTRILNAIDHGDAHAAEQLLPLVYDELRKLAAQKMAGEALGQTLQPTALVHEAYMRLVDADKVQHWNSRGHFFAAAAEAMRRILIENARRKKRPKHGGDRQRVDLEHADLARLDSSAELLVIDDAINQLAAEDAQAAQLVKLRYYAGLSVEQAAELVGISRSTAYEHWAYARAWLLREVRGRPNRAPG
jgi:RNA polymerase sigma factor (TIGR02999 family)